MKIEQTTIPAGARLTDHQHPSLLLRLLDRGETLETAGRGVSECAPGDIRISPSGAVHEIRAQDREVAVRLVNLRPELQRALPGTLDRPHFVTGDSAANLPARVFEDLQSSNPFAIESAALELMARCLSGACSSPAWLNDLRDELEHSSSEPHSLESLSRTYRRHPSHVSRTFRAHFGRSIGDHVLARRLYHAARLLRETETSIVSIALDLGFYDQPHFNRVFQRQFGETPGKYRRNGPSST